MITREFKENEIKVLSEKLSKSAGAFVVDFKGMKVEQITSLRKKLHSAQSEMKIVRNTLAKRALSKYPAIASSFGDILKGTNAFIFSYGEVNATAKTLADFAKDVDVLQIKTGMMGGAPLDGAKIKFLAGLPGKDALRAQFLGTLMEPATQMARVLDAYVRKQQGESSSEPPVAE